MDTWFKFDAVSKKFHLRKLIRYYFLREFYLLGKYTESINNEISNGNIVIDFAIVKEDNIDAKFGSTRLLKKYDNEIINENETFVSSNASNFDNFNNGDHVAELSNYDLLYGDWLSTDTAKVLITVTNFAKTGDLIDYQEIFDFNLVTQDFISLQKPSTLFNNFIYDYELVDGVTDFSTDLSTVILF